MTKGKEAKRVTEEGPTVLCKEKQRKTQTKGYLLAIKNQTSESGQDLGNQGSNVRKENALYKSTEMGCLPF